MTSLRKQIQPEVRNARNKAATIECLATGTSDTPSRMKFTVALSEARHQWSVTAKKPPTPTT